MFKFFLSILNFFFVLGFFSHGTISLSIPTFNISELYIDNWNINKDCVITGAFNNIQVDTLNLKAFNLRELYKGYSFMSGSKIRQLFINEEDYKDSGVRKRVHESSTFMLIKF